LNTITFSVGERNMSARKGIAIQLETQLLKKLDDKDMSRNDIIKKALETYFVKEEDKKESAFITVAEESPLNEIHLEDRTENLYNEIYSNLYNTEVIPLKKEIDLQRELIETLQYEIEEYRNDKEFLKHHIRLLFEQPPKKISRFNKKRRKEEIHKLQNQK